MASVLVDCCDECGWIERNLPWGRCHTCWASGPGGTAELERRLAEDKVRADKIEAEWKARGEAYQLMLKNNPVKRAQYNHYMKVLNEKYRTGRFGCATPVLPPIPELES